jgi:hypothetical protein
MHTSHCVYAAQPPFQVDQEIPLTDVINYEWHLLWSDPMLLELTASDDLKTPGENINFQTTILSRFDMISALALVSRVEEGK